MKHFLSEKLTDFSGNAMDKKTTDKKNAGEKNIETPSLFVEEPGHEYQQVGVKGKDHEQVVYPDRKGYEER